MFGASSQDQKGLSDTNKFLTFLACEALFKQFYSLFKHYFKSDFVLITKLSSKKQ